MYLLNTSIHVDRPHYDTAVSLVKNELIPALSATGLFRDLLLFDLLIDVDPSMKSFTLQMRSADLDAATDALDRVGAPIIEQLIKNCGGPEHAVTFTTPMRIID